MGKIKEILLEIEDRLNNNQSVESISKDLSVSADYITEVELEMNWSQFALVCEDPEYLRTV
jgi:DNA-directed RNA polymerase specialized sigma subunit